MQVPRFSLRMALILFTSAALFFVVVGKGLGGWAWAFGLAVGAASILAALAAHALFYWMFMGLGALLGAEEIIARTSQGGTVRASGDEAPRLEVPAPGDSA